MFYGFKVNVCMGYKLFWCFKIAYFYSSGTIQVLLPGNCWRAERPAKFRSLRWVTRDGQQNIFSYHLLRLCRHLYAMVKQLISLTLFFSCRKICSAVGWLFRSQLIKYTYLHMCHFLCASHHDNGSAASRSRWHRCSNMNSTILLPPPTRV